MAIIIILASIAVPAYSKLIQKARETSVIAYLAKMVRAQEIHYIDSPTASYSADFDELESTGMISHSTGVELRVEHDYTFTLDAGMAAGEPYWNVTADPVNSDGDAKWFYADQSGVMRFEVGATAGPASPRLRN